jgi:hypothetical protein
MRLLVAVLIAGCGGSDEELSCEYLASPDNCWKTTATAATSCLPAEAETGVLAADNASCTYASGHVIAFASPLVLPLPNNAEWNFTVTANGTDCLHYVDSNDGFELTVGSDTVSEELAGAAGLELTCPNSTTFGNSSALALLSCPDSNFGNLPGNTTSSSDTSVRFALLNTGVDTLPIFDCAK